MAKDIEYTGKDISVLTDREHVRQRTNVYLGNMQRVMHSIPILSATKLELQPVEFVPAAYKAIGEIIDNSLDEFSHLTTKNKVLRIIADSVNGIYTVADNGRGVPIDKHKTGKFTPEVVFGSLRSGRNFHDEKEIGVIGMNGVGSSCTNYCSSQFEVTIKREGQQYYQKFTNGAKTVSKPTIAPSDTPKATGTELTFRLDPEVFKEGVAIPDVLIRNRAMEIAMMNPDITVDYNNEKFKYKNGLLDYVTALAGPNGSLFTFPINEPTLQGEIHVLLSATKSLDEQMFTWANNSLLFDGGLCNTQFFNALFEKVITTLTPAAKKVKAEVTKNDARYGLLVFANLKMKNPQYDSQAKTRLTGPNFRKELNKALDDNWVKFTKNSKTWFDAVLARAAERHHRQADAGAIDDHQKNLKRKKPEGLLDATSRDRSICQLLITEGESANGQISMSRDPVTTGAFALSGKVNNVFGTTVAQVLKMGKITNLLIAIGLTPGKRVVRSALNFSKVIIATDADYDGDDIFTLLINIFYTFWPELFDPNYEPIIYRMIAPNVCLIKGEKRIHFPRRSEYEKVKERYKGYEVKYYKGLGSMNKKDWDMCLSGETDTFVPFTDDGKIKDVLNLLFSDDSDARKQWLTTST